MEHVGQPPSGLVEVIADAKALAEAQKARGRQGVEIFFVAGIILYLQVVSVVLFLATPDDLRIFVSTPLVRVTDIMSYVFYPVVVGAFFRLLVADPPQVEWAAAWGAALLINMVNGAWLCLAAPEDDLKFANFSTGVWACAFCLAAATIWKLLKGIAVQASQIVSEEKLAVGGAMSCIVMVYWAALLLASTTDERAACFVSGMQSLAVTSCLVFIYWFWGLIKDLLMDERMLAAISVVVVVCMATFAGVSLGETKEEKVACAWVGIFAFAIFATVVLFARMLRSIVTMFVSLAQLGALACIVTINMVFVAALCLSSTKEEKLAALWAYLWTYAAVAAVALVIWLCRLLSVLFQSEGRIAALAMVTTINMTAGALWCLASSQHEKIAVLWVGVLALGGCTVLAGVSWVVGLLDSVLEEDKSITGAETYETIGKLLESIDEGGHVRARMRRASVSAGRRMSELLRPMKDLIESQVGRGGGGVMNMMPEGPVRRVRRMSQAMNEQKHEEELGKIFSDFLKREDAGQSLGL